MKRISFEDLTEDSYDVIITELDEVLEELADTKYELKSSEREVENLEYQLSDVQENLEDAEEKIAKLEDEIYELEDTQEAFDSLDEEMKEEWWQEAKKMYTLPQLESLFGPKNNLRKIW